MAVKTKRSPQSQFTQYEAVELVADALGASAKYLDAESKVGDIVEWDSMGILSILTALSREGIAVDADEIGSLGSMQGILAAFRAAGRLK